MVIFQMKISEVLQGEFALRPLNLLLVFQVNCPGCFMYALPLAARLHDQYGDRVNILGLSTAFEDFDLNTADNTRRLLTTGEVVGMTKLHLAQQGQTAYTVPMRFPVAFDAPDGQTQAMRLSHRLSLNWYLLATPSAVIIYAARHRGFYWMKALGYGHSGLDIGLNQRWS